jgi:hypothetical protein
MLPIERGAEGEVARRSFLRLDGGGVDRMSGPYENSGDLAILRLSSPARGGGGAEAGEGGVGRVDTLFGFGVGLSRLPTPPLTAQ